jgi:putative NADPH-quinone reductase
LAAFCRRIVLIQGHPDGHGHYCHALAEHYALGARSAGHQIEVVNIAALAGARPIRQTPIGLVDAKDGGARERWLRRMTALGQRAR